MSDRNPFDPSRHSPRLDLDWSLFCPNESPGLPDVYGEKFEALYTRYEAQGGARYVVKARALWAAILDAQVISSRNECWR